DLRKPRGLTVVPPGTEAGFLAGFDVRKLPGIGPKAEARLRAAGVQTIGALAGLDDSQLKRLLPGSVGRVLRDRAHGIDHREREIAELACGLLDRALSDRPGALRLVGVGVSGLSDYRQLAFPALSDKASGHPSNG